MAETDFRPLSQLKVFNKKLDGNSLLPMTVKSSGSTITRKFYYLALKSMIEGYEIAGVLTAGSTSITLSSAATETYNDQHTYAVGSRVTHTDEDEVTRNYLCIQAVTTAGNWETNSEKFVEYSPINSNSNIKPFTTELGVNPTSATVSNNEITLTFEAQSSDIGVKVRVY